jgi:alpha-1,6-mannosyltransferase
VSPAVRAHLLVLAALASAAGMAAGALWSRPLFVGAGLVGCLVAWAAGSAPGLRTRHVLLVAVTARALVFPLPPALSDDGYRYVWDGILQAEGVNPYAYRPSEVVRTHPEQEALIPLLNSEEFYSVYPPSSQLLFRVGGYAAASGWEWGWYTIKGLLTLMEIGGLFLLARMVGPGALALYAWHPLPIMEAAGQGHTEAGMVGLLLLAAWALRKGRGGVAGAALAGAGGFKLVPLLFLPFALRQQPLRVLAGAGVAAALLAVPYAAPYVLAHVGESLRLYIEYFEWYAGPYFLLKAVAAWGTGDGQGGVIGPLLQIGFLLTLGLLWGLHRRRGWPPEVAWLLVSGAFLATATTVHPWYLLGVLALIPLSPLGTAHWRWHAASWHLLAAGALGTYLFYTHGDGPYGLSVIAGWIFWTLSLGTAAGTWGLPRLLRRRARTKWALVRPHLPPSGRLLDLGAGEGLVGERAQADGFSVELADVLDLNRTELPLTLLEEGPLPFREGAFDASLLVYVLHHTFDPDALLAEVSRVTSGRVVVLESVVETGWDRAWLPLADRLANGLRSGGAISEALNLRDTAGWREAFERAGFEVCHVESRGGAWHRQRLFVLEPLNS